MRATDCTRSATSQTCVPAFKLYSRDAKLTILPLAKVIEPFRKRGPGERRVGVVLADCGELFRLPRFVPDSKPLGGGQWSLTAKAGLFPVKIEGECDVCGPPGSTCVVEIPFAENPVIPLAECPPPTAVTSAEFATNLTLPRKAPSLGPIKKVKVVDPSVIYLKDATGTTLVELDVELTVD